MAQTCPSCGVGKMMPEKFSNYYMCDFCGNRVYHWSGSSGGSGSLSRMDEIEEELHASLDQMKNAADEVKRSGQAYINASHRADAAEKAAKKVVAKKKRDAFWNKVCWAIVILWLLSKFL